VFIRACRPWRVFRGRRDLEQKITPKAFARRGGQAERASEPSQITILIFCALGFLLLKLRTIRVHSRLPAVAGVSRATQFGTEQSPFSRHPERNLRFLSSLLYSMISRHLLLAKP